MPSSSLAEGSRVIDTNMNVPERGQKDDASEDEEKETICSTEYIFGDHCTSPPPADVRFRLIAPIILVK